MYTGPGQPFGRSDENSIASSPQTRRFQEHIHISIVKPSHSHHFYVPQFQYKHKNKIPQSHKTAHFPISTTSHHHTNVPMPLLRTSAAVQLLLLLLKFLLLLLLLILRPLPEFQAQIHSLSPTPQSIQLKHAKVVLYRHLRIEELQSFNKKRNCGNNRTSTLTNKNDGDQFINLDKRKCLQCQKSNQSSVDHKKRSKKYAS